MKEYERLTKKEGVGRFVKSDCITCKSHKDDRTGCDFCKGDDLSKTWCCGVLYNRLKELEEKIEQGYIKILPVKAGDKIYVVPSKVNFDLNRINRYHEHNRVYEQTVNEIRFFQNGVYMVYSCDYLQNHHSEFFGETWFLTREEAEAKLKELREGAK